MFKLQRTNNKPSKQREKLDFKFSNFQALQPTPSTKGWDRLFVSLISIETGKTIAKLSKAVVRYGSCHWTETLSESITISRDDSSKEYEESLIKFVLSMGSTRSSILGEATINMANYISSRVSAAVSLPLKKCSYGTVLQVKIQCLTPRSKTRDEEARSSNSQESLSDSGDGTQSRDHVTTSHPLKFDSKETSQTKSSPNHSFNSSKGSIGGEKPFTRNALKTDEYISNERRAGGRLDDSPVYDSYLVDNESPSNQASLYSDLYSKEDSRNETALNRSLTNTVGSAKDLLEAAEGTLEELLEEAIMWERNSRKLMIDLDISRKEFSDLSKKQADLVMELSAARAEDDSLKREVEQLKLESTKQANQENFTIQYERMIQIQKEQENEIKYQKDVNANLGQQLEKTQESNIELISVLQEIEETIEQQKIEIENLSSLKLDFTELENPVARISEEHRTLLLQLEQLQESEKKLLVEVQLLEESLRDKSTELENERETNGKFLFKVEKDYMDKFFVKEEEIARLEAKLSSHAKVGVSDVMCDSDETNADIIREVEFLREKIQELEKDCAELTDENLELFIKIKESNKTEIKEFASFDSLSSEHPTVSASDESKVSDPKFPISQLDEKFGKKVNEDMQNCGFESSEQYLEFSKQVEVAFDRLMKPWCIISSNTINGCNNHLIHDCTPKDLSAESVLSFLLELNKLLETRTTECEEIHRYHEAEIKEKNDVIDDYRKRMEDFPRDIKEHEQLNAKAEENYADIVELDEKRSEVDLIKADFLSMEEEVEFLLQHQKDLQDEVCELEQKNSHLEKNCEVMLSEKLEELAREKHNLEINISGLRDEKMQLQENISRLKSQVRHLNDEKDRSKSDVVSLQGEIHKLKDEFEIQLLELKQISEDMKKQWLKAQEECEFLKTENPKLQASNQELHERCSLLASQLNQANKSLFECDKKVEFLENHLTSVLKDFAFRESNLVSKLDALVHENISQQEKLDRVISEKTTEFESLLKEVDHLKRQIADSNKEKERISIEAAAEVSRLLTERTELQASFEEVQSKAESTKNKLDAVRLDYDTKVQGLISQLASSQESNETLMADHERVLKLLANYKTSEEKLKTEKNDLELKLTISDYERQQLTKETGLLKVQLQSMSDRQNEISILKSELKECRLDNGKLELALQTVTRDYEELNAERIALSEKISVLHEKVSEFEECQSKKSELEEKLLIMENELAVKEILHAQNSELKNEISAIKRENTQFQKKIYKLEEEKEECSRKAHSFEEEFKKKFNSHKKVTYDSSLHDERPLAVASKECRLLHGSSFSSGPNNFSVISKKSADDGQVVPSAKYEHTKSSLETELRDLRDRYLEMSLKYAEVESQREDLVMKLKETRSGKRWFS